MLPTLFPDPLPAPAKAARPPEPLVIEPAIPTVSTEIAEDVEALMVTAPPELTVELSMPAFVFPPMLLTPAAAPNVTAVLAIANAPAPAIA